MRKRWLLSLRPKPGEIRNAQPEGIFQARTGARYCEVSRRPKLCRSPRPPYISTPPMKFCGHSVQCFAEAFKASGRLAPRAYPNSHGEFERSFAASVFSVKFHPLNVLDRMSFNSIS